MPLVTEETVVQLYDHFCSIGPALWQRLRVYDSYAGEDILHDSCLAFRRAYIGKFLRKPLAVFAVVLRNHAFEYLRKQAKLPISYPPELLEEGGHAKRWNRDENRNLKEFVDDLVQRYPGSPAAIFQVFYECGLDRRLTARHLLREEGNNRPSTLQIERKANSIRTTLYRFFKQVRDAEGRKTE